MIRVYELARDLNMNNKAMLDKLSILGIAVKSHMSSLDDETVSKVKASIFSGRARALDQTRVKPTVIRRRKVVQPESAEAIPPDETAPSIAAKEAAVEPGIEQPSPVEALHPEEIVSPAEKEAPPSAFAAETPPVVPPLVEAEAEPPAPAVEAQETVSVPEPEQAVAAVEGETPASAGEFETLEAGAQAGEALIPASGEPAAERPEKSLKPLKGKKTKKDFPARIIRLPEPTPVSTPVPKAPEARSTPAREPDPARIARERAERPAVARRGAPEIRIIQQPEPQTPSQLKDKKKGKKKVEETPEEKKFIKKKVPFKKKEVIEGVDLYAEDSRLRKGARGARGKAPKGLKPQITVPKAIKRRVKIDDTIVLSDLAKRLGIKAGEMIRKLMDLGVMVTVNQTIDFDTAVLVAAEFGYELERASFEEESVIKTEKDDPSTLKSRPPVVTIMGHVDHGKTSLLDVIRKTRVTEGEAGGITQHIGAYNVATEKGQIVFLDTPGHEAFTAMRSRGAKVTDIVVLVVAADDGVMPQTLEAINHSKAASVPIIVAVNKMDKPDADPERVSRQLSDVGLIPEEWGGTTIFVKVSAKQNQGINELLDMILLQAELMELKANPSKLATGYVIEAKLDSGRGAFATVLVQEGTLRTGDPIVCGVHSGKVRAMLNDRGIQVDIAEPSIPVGVIGLSGVPMAGDQLIALADDKDAKQISMHRMQKQRSKDLAQTSKLSLEKLFENIQQGKVKDLNLIIKADVHGSIEALRDSLVKLSNEEVKINVIHAATGTITESDVSLASVSDAVIIGFNVRPSWKVQEMATEENVSMHFYNIIYDVIKDIKNAILGMMSSRFEERTLGRAEVREVFHVPKVGAIAGCYVTDGKIERGQRARLLRDGVVAFDGKLSSLRRFKDDVREVQSGYECGIGIENFNDIKIGDRIECYFLEEIKPEI